MQEQLGTGIGIVAGLLILAVFGGNVGWVASLLIRGTTLGLIGDIVQGMLGAVVGGGLFQALGLSIGGGIIGAFVLPRWPAHYSCFSSSKSSSGSDPCGLRKPRCFSRACWRPPARRQALRGRRIR